jgi:hypothetical protein
MAPPGVASWPSRAIGLRVAAGSATNAHHGSGSGGAGQQHQRHRAGRSDGRPGWPCRARAGRPAGRRVRPGRHPRPAGPAEPAMRGRRRTGAPCNARWPTAQLPDPSRAVTERPLDRVSRCTYRATLHAWGLQGRASTAARLASARLRAPGGAAQCVSRAPAVGMRPRSCRTALITVGLGSANSAVDRTARR